MLGSNRVALHSSYVSIARRAGLCTLQCQICDCGDRVAGVLNGLGIQAEYLLEQEGIPPDIQMLLKTSERQGGDMISTPEDACGHVDVMRIPKGVLIECPDKEL